VISQSCGVGFWYFSLVSTLVTIGILASSESSVLAQLREDNTLGTESSVVTPTIVNGQVINQIDGGATRGTNLFHSFEQFSVVKDSTAYFNNPSNIKNIISRVTGNSISNIDGILKANGTANLFLINPNGIIFGANAALDIGGSFVASTASSVNFKDDIQFSATEPQTIPLLKLSVPIGLQFGSTAATIVNHSQARASGRPVGLAVKPNQTLALVGGDILLQGGNLTAKGGRIELGSVASDSFVSFSTNQDLSLGYAGVKDFQNITITRRGNVRSYVDASGESGGDIQIQGKNVQINGAASSSIFTNASNRQQRGNLTVTASNSVELIGGTPLRVGNMNEGVAGNLTITTGRLIVKNGAQVLLDNSNSQSDVVPQLTVNARESVELTGGSLGPFNRFISSGLFSATYGVGNAGDITINTPRLIVQGGAQISTISGERNFRGIISPATGKGGNLTVNATESIELSGVSVIGSTPSSLTASTNTSGSAGNVNLSTRQLIIRDGAVVSVSSQAAKDVTYVNGAINLGQAGDINVKADSIILNDGKLTSNSDLGKGGNITLNIRDLLLMRRQSQIATDAQTPLSSGDGGKININAPSAFIIAHPLENNDITANGFSGAGGQITITAVNIFGFVPRNRADLVKLLNTEDPNKLKPSNSDTNDITAFSQESPSLNGIIQINSPDVDPSNGLVKLPISVIDTSRVIADSCNGSGKLARGKFTVTGRGGIAASPTEPLMADQVIADWITLDSEIDNHVSKPNQAVISKQTNTQNHLHQVNSVNQSDEIVEAQGWVMNAEGNIVLLASAPNVIPNNLSIPSASCAAQ
jgi:filamentous hemagglutinin family protein